MNILVLCGDPWHPAGLAREGLGALAGNEFTFDWVESLADWMPETLMPYPAVILAKSNHVSASDAGKWMTEEGEAAFAEYMQSGKGLLAIHSGTAEYAESPVLRGLLGGVFSYHPEQCPVTMTPKPDHPLCVGVTPFTLQDEHYFMTMEDPAVDVFLTSSSVHGEQPAGWRHAVGKGRAAVITPGHNLEVWLHASFQVLLANALRWCGNSMVTASKVR